MIATTRGSLVIDGEALVFVRNKDKEIVFPGKPGWDIAQYTIKKKTVVLQLQDRRSSLSLLAVHNLGEKSYLYHPSLPRIDLVVHDDFFYVSASGRVRRSYDGVVWQTIMDNVFTLQKIPNGIVFFLQDCTIVNGKRIATQFIPLAVTSRALVTKDSCSGKINVTMDDGESIINPRGFWGGAAFCGVMEQPTIIVTTLSPEFFVSRNDGLSWSSYCLPATFCSALITDGKFFVLTSPRQLLHTEDFIMWTPIVINTESCVRITINYTGDLVCYNTQKCLYRPTWSLKKYPHQIPCKREKDRQILLTFRRLKSTFSLFREVMSY
jgi:hypothetical protein